MKRIALLLSLALVACGASEPPPNKCEIPPSYEKDLRPELVEAKCIQCHSENLSGLARGGAPEELNFDRYDLLESVRREFVDAITSGREPPRSAGVELEVNEEERALVVLWQSCGYLP